MIPMDPSQLMMLAVVGLAGFAFNKLQEPQKRQQQMVYMVLAAGAAYVFKQIEGRGGRQEDLRVALAGMEGRFNEQFRTLFNEVESLKREMHKKPDPARAR